MSNFNFKYHKNEIFFLSQGKDRFDQCHLLSLTWNDLDKQNVGFFLN